MEYVLEAVALEGQFIERPALFNDCPGDFRTDFVFTGKVYKNAGNLVIALNAFSVRLYDVLESAELWNFGL